LTSGQALGGAASRHARARELSATAGKSNRGAPGYSRWVNRPLGRQLAILAFQVGLTPNQVTLVSGAVTLTGIAVLALSPATPVAGLAVAALLALGYALDSADGQLARMRGQGSTTGEWLDHVIDCVKIASLHMAVLVSWYRNFDLPPEALLVPMVFGIQASTFFFTKILTDALRAAHTPVVDVAPPSPASPPTGAAPSTPPGATRAPVLASLAVLPLDYGLLCIVFALLGFHTAFLWAYSTLAVLGVALLAAGFSKWYRDLSRLG
jgi:phosphatidylglycerophosphate synthase